MRAGKTILVSSLVEECQSRPDDTVIYFYCKNNDPERSSFNAIARSMLAQMLQKHRDIFLPILYNYCLESPKLRSFSECQQILQMALQTVDKSYILIDGLDECDKKERTLVISCLKKILEIMDHTEPGKCRLLIASQEENDIRLGLSKAAGLKITRENVQEDISRFIKDRANKLQEKFELTSEVHESITKTTAESSQGMFQRSFPSVS